MSWLDEQLQWHLIDLLINWEVYDIRDIKQAEPGAPLEILADKHETYFLQV